MLAVSPTDVSFCVFETAIGQCAIAWHEQSVVAVGLPEGDDAETRARLLKRWPDATERCADGAAHVAIDQIRALLRGEPADLTSIALDMSEVSDFERRVYQRARAIPPGQTLTYGEIARAIGEPDASRAVGRALGRNPFPIVVPCHRVLAAQSKSGGFSAHGGVATKLRLLAIEGAQTPQTTTLFP